MKNNVNRASIGAKKNLIFKSSFHEKLTRLLALMLILVASVNQAKADTNISFSGGYIYFADEYDVHQGSTQLCGRKSNCSGGVWYTAVTTLSNIGHTKLYYTSSLEGSGWSNVCWAGWALISNSSGKSNSGTEYWSGSNSTWYSNFNSYGFNSGSTYLITVASASKGASATTSYKSSGYSALNNNQTVYKYTSSGGTSAASYTAQTVNSGTVTISAYKMTGNGTASNSSNSGTINTANATSTTKPAAFTGEVTLTASANSGYTFMGWFESTSATTAVSTETTYTYNAPNSTKSIYARFKAEATHSVTHTEYCTSTSTQLSTETVSVGEVTYSEFSAPVKAGYTFANWTYGNGISLKAGDSNTSNPIHVKTLSTGTYTLQANYTEDLSSPWHLLGASTPFGGWSSSNSNMLQKASGSSTGSVASITINVSALPSAEEYTFKLYNATTDKWRTNAGYWVTRENNNPTLNTEGGLSNELIFKPDVTGNYIFSLDYSSSDPVLTVTFPTSYTLTYDIGTVKGNDGSISSSPTTASGSYVVSGNTVTLTAPSEKTGYSWKGWYLAADGSGAQQCATKAYAITMNADKTVYACYTEDDYTVFVIAGDGGSVASDNVTAHKDTKVTLPTATPSSGYYFTGWDVIEGTASLTSSSSANAAKINGVTSNNTVTVRANFHPDDKIYFDNTYTQWNNVYIYLFTAESYWSNSTQNGVHPQINRPTGFVPVAMTKVAGEEDLYEYAYHTSSHNYDNFNHVAFSQYDQKTYDCFSEQHAAYRGDWRASMPIYVAPSYYETISIDKDHPNDSHCYYHSDGYWMMKETTGGETINFALYNSSNVKQGDFVATSDGAHTATLTLRYDETSNKTYYINNIASQNYSVNHTFTAADDGESYDLWKYNDLIYFTVTPTSVGNYKFILEQGGEHMHISIQYPVQTGDRRLVYSYTSGGKTKYRYSDVIRAAETSAITSMYIDKDQSGAALKLQRCTGFDGSGNPTWGDAKTELISYFSTKGKGVYKMTVNFAGTNDVSSTLSDIGLYTGEYYIKTDCAPGGWANYKQNVMSENTINPSATFNYSYCKWVGNTSTNIRCVIANDYNNAISDTLKDDAILNRGGVYETLPEAANVRFSFNSTTNELKRTYLRGSTLTENFVTLVPNAAGYVYSAQTGGTDYYSSNPKFADNGNWTYQMDAWIYPTSQAGVKTQYPGWAPITTETLVPTTNLLMGGETKGSVRYHVRLVYDYKTDYLMSAWLPDGTVTQNIDLLADFLVIRNAQNQAVQLSFNTGKKVTNAQHAYAAFQFNKNDMVGQMGSWNDRAYQQCVYYFSFPFDVNVSDIFGVGKMGVDWRIRKYNGAKRAEKGWFAETSTFWEDVTASDKLNAFEGYCLLLNRVKFNTDGGENNVWDNIGSGGSVYLYFPSSTLIGTISDKAKTITVPAHLCGIDRVFTQDLNKPAAQQRNHIYADSHWNMIGVPILSDTTMNLTTLGFTTVVNPTGHFKYFYEWRPTGDGTRNTLNITASTSFTFKSMFAYMAQFSGDIEFQGAVVTPPSPVAAHQKAETKHYMLELELVKAEEAISRAYVELRENAKDSFLLNEDVYMMGDSKVADIYTFAGAYDVAANVLSIDNHIIPVGVNVKTAGTYTFSMPSNFDGTVTLVDKFANTRTNLAISDYEVALEQAEIDDRFELEIEIEHVTSNIENIETCGSIKDGGVHKFLKDGQMYILKNGVIYDARGARIQ